MNSRIYTSSPDVGEVEEQYVLAAEHSGWRSSLSSFARRIFEAPANNPSSVLRQAVEAHDFGHSRSCEDEVAVVTLLLAVTARGDTA
jgi:hypothetical protein